VARNSKQSKHKWCFPFIGNIEDNGAARTMTAYLRKAHTLNPELIWGDICGTGLRIGSANTMFAAGVNEIVVTARGGWDASKANDNKAFEYFIAELFNIVIGGRALAGWAHPEVTVYAPTLNVVKTFSEDRVNDFRRFLFNTFSYASHMPDQTVQTMCATVLAHLSEFRSTYTDNHVVVSALKTKGERYGFTLDQLTSLGEVIKNEYELANLHRLPPSRGAEDINVALAKSLNSTMLSVLHSVQDMVGKQKNADVLLRRVETQLSVHARDISLLLQKSPQKSKSPEKITDPISNRYSIDCPSLNKLLIYCTTAILLALYGCQYNPR
jgi:hypothetical protein